MSGEPDLSDLPDDPTELMFAMLDESGGEWRPVDNALTSRDGPSPGIPISRQPRHLLVQSSRFLSSYGHLLPVASAPSNLVLSPGCAIYPLFGGVLD